MTRFLLAAALVFGVEAVARSQQPIFKTNVDLVSVDVLVTDRGKQVTGLAASNFEVRDNGVLQRLESVTLERVPLDIVLVLDTSLSVAGERLRHLKEAALAVLGALRPGDRVALVTFHERVVLGSPLTADAAAVAMAINRAEAGGSTSAFDALYAALSLRESGPSRCLTLLFTDGLDNTSWITSNDVLTAVQQSDTVVYGIGTDKQAAAGFKSIAEETGGEALVASSTRQLRELFVRTVREMQARYLLTYYPQGVPRPGWHNLSVRLAGASGQVRARRGYLVPGPGTR